MGARERLLLYRHTNVGDGQIDVIPQAVVAREDAMHLARAAEANGGKLRVRFAMPNKIGGPVEQMNVVGEIRGREKPDEAVILGAHLDSWELGTGALDNGCNAALVIEAARAIRATGLVPRRTIRFILFSGEEQGMVGSWQYVQAHRAEMDKIRGVIIFDDGSGRTPGFSLSGRGGYSRRAERDFAAAGFVGREQSRAGRRHWDGQLGFSVGWRADDGGESGRGELLAELSRGVGYVRQGGYCAS